jgi:hypothetical protein
MGTMTFLLPANLSPELVRELERGWVASTDHMPWPTRVQVKDNQLIVEKQVNESGYLVAPWRIEGAGQLMTASATLMERPVPYHLLVELARGKLHQLRRQAASWQEDGLVLSASVERLMQEAGRALCDAVATSSVEEADRAACIALGASYQASEELVQDYMAQALPLRRACQPDLKTALGCRVSSALDREAASALASDFDRVSLTCPWSRIEPSEGRFDWMQYDALLESAEKERLTVTGGPVVDFSGAQLPEWLRRWERDVKRLGKFLSRYIVAVLTRYHGRIHRWHLTSASSSASVLSLSEQELLWLTLKAVREARHIDPGLVLILGVAQPWCDYMGRSHREQSALLFAETLVRELRPEAVELELIMGVGTRGSYCRDLLETSRLLDRYGDLGVPLWITLGYPSTTDADPNADPELAIDAGHRRGGIDENAQAEWSVSFAKLALCKPYVEAVHWAHFTDASPHQYPHCGLLNASGRPKPAFGALRQFRDRDLR